jgi:hypothetical protein
VASDGRHVRQERDFIQIELLNFKHSSDSATGNFDIIKTARTIPFRFYLALAPATALFWIMKRRIGVV